MSEKANRHKKSLRQGDLYKKCMLEMKDVLARNLTVTVPELTKVWAKQRNGAQENKIKTWLRKVTD